MSGSKKAGAPVTGGTGRIGVATAAAMTSRLPGAGRTAGRARLTYASAGHARKAGDA
ncbi:hypothetical protein ACKI1O_36430 [Streptomyces scabiei]